MADFEERNSVAVSVKGAKMLKAVRRRTELELARRSVDLTTGGPKATMVAAIAVAAALPVADATHVFDGLTDATDLALLGAEDADKGQQAPCKKRCSSG